MTEAWRTDENVLAGELYTKLKTMDSGIKGVKVRPFIDQLYYPPNEIFVLIRMPDDRRCPVSIWHKGNDKVIDDISIDELSQMAYRGYMSCVHSVAKEKES